MSYLCRVFAKDVQALQDIKKYTIEEKEFKFVSDDGNKLYTLEDTEYVVVPTNVFKEMIDTIYVNSQKTKKYKKVVKTDNEVKNNSISE